MTVEVMVNGTGPYRFVVDSGADTSVVGLRIASELQLPLGAPAILHVMSGSSRVDRVKVDELQLGATKVRNLQVPALLETDLGADGLVGIDALAGQRLMMDFEKRLIKVEDARQRVRPQPGDIVVTAKRRRGQLILTQVRAAGLNAEAVIDTGSEITIGNPALRDRLIRRNRGNFTTVTATGVTGVKMELQVATIPELRLGSVILRDVPIAFADVRPFSLFGLSEQPALLLGTDLMGVFRRVSLDFRARKVRFQLKRCGTTGISVGNAGTFTSRLSSGGNDDVCRR
jgi:predicted aspartyl protease